MVASIFRISPPSNASGSKRCFIGKSWAFNFLLNNLFVCVAGNYCDIGFTQFEGACYKYTSAGTDWHTANSLCENENSNLAVIHNQTENDRLLSYLLTHVYLYPYAYQSVWLGGYSSGYDDTSIWVDGTTFGGYDNWYIGQETHDPSLWYDDDCFGMYLAPSDSAAGQWMRAYCYEYKGSICEKSPGRESIQYNGFTYQRFLAGKSWIAAQSQCQQGGGTLAQIKSHGGSIILGLLFPHQSFWIGANDSAVEGTWAWADGTIVGYVEWASGEPDDDAGGAGQDCAAAAAGGGAWTDEACADHLPFVCQYPCAAGDCGLYAQTDGACQYRYFGDAALGWAAARAVCAGEGGDLASAASARANHLLYWQAGAAGYGDHADGVYASWIGGARPSASAAWGWSDGSDWHFTSWHPDLTYLTDAQHNLNCVQLYEYEWGPYGFPAVGTWVAADCDLERRFFCQRGCGATRVWGGSVYELGTAGEAFGAAEARCEGQGAALASLGTEDEVGAAVVEAGLVGRAWVGDSPALEGDAGNVHANCTAVSPAGAPARLDCSAPLAYLCERNDTALQVCALRVSLSVATAQLSFRLRGPGLALLQGGWLPSLWPGGIGSTEAAADFHCATPSVAQQYETHFVDLRSAVLGQALAELVHQVQWECGGWTWKGVYLATVAAGEESGAKVAFQRFALTRSPPNYRPLILGLSIPIGLVFCVLAAIFGYRPFKEWQRERRQRRALSQQAAGSCICAGAALAGYRRCREWWQERRRQRVTAVSTLRPPPPPPTPPPEEGFVPETLPLPPGRPRGFAGSLRGLVTLSMRARERECKICMGGEADAALVPCGHLVACEGCARRLEGGLCPICRRGVVGVQRVYLA
mmetsp:Transcript_19754/g.34710  ORF Transcript_19754/g.34710 Transcript_19754/m.34710 type:complete len:867 (-) Transcript_19754:278-2878(-)